jgi:hypothetical protein
MLIHLNLIFVWAENYMDAIVCFAYYMGCIFCGRKNVWAQLWAGINIWVEICRLKKLYGLKYVG